MRSESDMLGAVRNKFERGKNQLLWMNILCSTLRPKISKLVQSIKNNKDGWHREEMRYEEEEKEEEERRRRGRRRGEVHLKVNFL